MAQCAPHLLWNRYSASKPATVQNTSGITDIVDLHSRECLALFANYWAQQVRLTAAERAKICTNTVGQSNNPLRQAERTGRLTASNFYRILRCIKPEGLVRDILYPRKKENLGPSDPRLYGLRNEAVAVESYRTIMRLYDKDIEVYETGLHVHETYAFIAASPDRLVRDGAETGLLEVKCPASKAGQTITEACQDKTFCAKLVDGSPTLKRDHPYFFQIQGQLAVTGKTWCDFVVWTNRSELHLSTFVERIYFDEDVWCEILQALIYFYKAAIIPELLTRRIRRLGFLYTTGAGYVPYKKYAQGFYIAEPSEDPVTLIIRKLK
ncbi:uncharacterized protein LOC125756983 [Rhipicephalus sanguineus]|uniref:uncharacterized protein LOC125756983 n=1 Tax=Rhipicephalus sanguineus TaxID=34632 RepID=UPI0020C2D52F|nr:uncharacterized protein LOC125756983 [Rhipicephalus sanguineus]